MGPGKDCRETALGLLARREHARKELRFKLAARGFPEGEIETTLEALEQERLLSDRRFTEAYSRARFDRGFGAIRIRAELRERGVEEALIDEHLAAFAGQWLAAARREHRKKYGARAAGDYQERAKRARFLQGRGFSHDIIMQVIDNAD